MKYKMLVILMSLLCVSVSYGLTAQQIVDSVVDELDDINDYESDFAIDFDDAEIDDMTGGTIQLKHTNGLWKRKYIMGSPYTQTIKTDGSNKYNVLDSSTDWSYWYFSASSNYDYHLHNTYASDMINMENILSSETWTKSSNETLGSTECYKIYTTKSEKNYVVWIDTDSAKKVIRVTATDYNDNLRWQLDFSSYASVEGVQIAGTVVAQRYISGQEDVELTYTFSNININENISDSVFSVNTPNGY